jgi:hypothetical protein
MDTDAVRINAPQASALVAERGGEEVMRETHVNGELGKLADAVERLHVLVARIEDRCGPVLNPNVLTPAAGPSDIEAELAPAANRIRTTRQHVEHAIERLGVLHDRLEI